MDRNENSLMHGSQQQLQVVGDQPELGTAVAVESLDLVYTSRAATFHALSEIDLEVRQGEFLSLVGPSGCGKSSLVNVIAGLQSATGGNVIVNGKPVTEPITDIGIVFQEHLLLPWRTALQNVTLQAEIRGLPKGELRERAQELLELVGLGGAEEKLPHEMSGGMRQRCSVVRALVHSPSLLIMDEPFGAVDALTRDQLGMDLLRLWSETRPTVIFVTHSIEEAVMLSDRICVMDKNPGRIIETIPVGLGRPRVMEIRDSAEFRQITRQVRAMLETTAMQDTTGNDERP